nr:hypothetical protein [uncultured Roseibium sp.]
MRTFVLHMSELYRPEHDAGFRERGDGPGGNRVATICLAVPLQQTRPGGMDPDTINAPCTT